MLDGLEWVKEDGTKCLATEMIHRKMVLIPINDMPKCARHHESLLEECLDPADQLSEY
jgi:hypothetical protein